jgi:hypothetical protein
MQYLKLEDVSIHMNENGEACVRGLSKGWYEKELHITAKNPVIAVNIDNSGFSFQLKNKNTWITVCYRDILPNSGGFSTRRMNWAGLNLPAPSQVIFFIHDLVAEANYFHCMKNVMHREDAELEVDYLRERYKCIGQYIKDLDFDKIIQCLDFNKKETVRIRI